MQPSQELTKEQQQQQSNLAAYTAYSQQHNVFV
jgi:hypothetical protein